MQVHPNGDPLAVVPGVPALVVLEVFNDSEVIDGFTLSVGRLETLLDNGEIVNPTILVTPQQLSIFPETAGTLTATVTLPSGYPAGRRTAVLEVASVSGASESVQVDLIVDVAESPAATLTAIPQSVTGGRRAIFGLVIENSGNVPLEMAVSLVDGDNAVTGPRGTSAVQQGAGVQGPGEIDDQMIVSVAPRERADIRLPVSGRRPIIGTPITRIITFTADPGETVALAPLQVVTTFVQKPLVPRAFITVATLGLAMLLWGALLLAGVDRTTAQVADDIADLASLEQAISNDLEDEKAAAAAAAVAGSLEGSVTDTNARPVGGVTIEVAGPKAASTVTFTEGAIGGFAVDALPVPGSYTLTFRKDGYEPRIVLVELSAETPTARGVDVVLQRATGAVSGTVTDEQGAPLPDVRVRVSSDSPVGVPSVTTASGGSVGAYAFNGLDVPQRYTLTFERPGYISRTETVELTTDAASVTKDVVLLASATDRTAISGLVSEDIVRSESCVPQRCPLGAVVISVRNADGVTVGSAVSTSDGNATGRYFIDSLPPADYTLAFAKDGYESQAIGVTAVAGLDQTLDVVLSGQPGSIVGLAPGCARVEIRTRDLAPLNPPRTTEPAGNDGVFGVAELGTRGEYRVLFFGTADQDFRDVQVIDVNLGPGEDRGSVTTTCSTSAPANPPATFGASNNGPQLNRTTNNAAASTAISRTSSSGPSRSAGSGAAGTIVGSMSATTGSGSGVVTSMGSPQRMQWSLATALGSAHDGHGRPASVSRPSIPGRRSTDPSSAGSSASGRGTMVFATGDQNNG